MGFAWRSGWSRWDGVAIKGEAKDDEEVFGFSIGPFVSGGFKLSIRYSSDGDHNVAGAGVWPSIEKAEQIAQATAAKLLHGAAINWFGIWKLTVAYGRVLIRVPKLGWAV